MCELFSLIFIYFLFCFHNAVALDTDLVRLCITLSTITNLTSSFSILSNYPSIDSVTEAPRTQVHMIGPFISIGVYNWIIVQWFVTTARCSNIYWERMAGAALQLRPPVRAVPAGASEHHTHWVPRTSPRVPARPARAILAFYGDVFLHLLLYRLCIISSY